MVRSTPVPPSTIFAFGNSVGFPDVAVTTNEPGGVSASLMLKGMAGTTVFTVVARSAMLLIVGVAPTVVIVSDIMAALNRRAAPSQSTQTPTR